MLQKDTFEYAVCLRREIHENLQERIRSMGGMEVSIQVFLQFVPDNMNGIDFPAEFAVNS